MLRARLLYKLRCRFYASPLHGLTHITADLPQAAWKHIPPDLWGGHAALGQQIAAGEWTFLAHTLPLGTPPRTWFPPNASALWMFNLHYHDWLGHLRSANDKSTARLLIENWMDVCGPWHPVAWHPYPLSLRLVNWITHGPWLLADEPTDSSFAVIFRQLLTEQVRHLEANIEHWLGGNHVIKNLKALVYAGACLVGQEKTLLHAVAQLLQELRIQIHEDGGHYEASPTYHAQVLQDIVDIIAVLRKAGGAPDILSDTANSMANALQTWRHPDGTLALFNDGDTGDAAHLTKLIKKAGADETTSALPNTGYVRLARKDTVLILDAGKVGPDENPGHAHADTLSFELSWHGEKLIINGGTYAYQHAKRNTYRGTAAHSTVLVDKTNSADVWGVFRVGRRPIDVGFDAKNLLRGDAAVLAWHDGYRHLGVTHTRKILMAADGSMVRGEDDLRCTSKHKILGYFHLHPDVQARLENDDTARLTLPSGSAVLFTIRGGRLDIRDSHYAPQFGVLQATRALVIHPHPKEVSPHMEWLIKAA